MRQQAKQWWKEFPCLQILLRINEPLDATVNGEASRRDDHDCHQRAQNLVYRRCICTRDEPADQADISDDHDAEPEFEIRNLFLCLVQLRRRKRLALQPLINYRETR